VSTLKTVEGDEKRPQFRLIRKRLFRNFSHAGIRITYTATGHLVDPSIHPDHWYVGAENWGRFPQFPSTIFYFPLTAGTSEIGDAIVCMYRDVRCLLVRAKDLVGHPKVE
jgi:hypothetical protein